MSSQSFIFFLSFPDFIRRSNPKLLLVSKSPIDLSDSGFLTVFFRFPLQMSFLKESLNKFKQQQVKCQTTLTSIASRSSNSKDTQYQKSNSKPTNYSAPAKPHTMIKFSNDTERLQHINTIRKSPIGAQIKRVIDLLLETRKAFTAEQINEVCYVDINGNRGVFDSLKNNHKVKYDGNRFSYKSKHDLKDKTQLLGLIRKFPEGLPVIDVKDAYPSVMEDLQAIKAEGHVWLLSNMDSQEDIVYPNDTKSVVKVDDEMKQLFRRIEVPRDMIDIEKELQRNGMKPATNTAKRRATAQVQGVPSKPKQKKKREITKRTKLTNAHLPELFKI
ncbi:putative Transcription initiation factor IIE subunit beta [Zostera marina]|uniref:Putative Transcription initiation factor IIE subunit beta n=1 Tax=Zostera marina TaxID=29655 RepID=A0A0K9NRH0_ZOSMR|nr:putative Transcription initiation factor IIE subunit beta [Zostera marina]